MQPAKRAAKRAAERKAARNSGPRFSWPEVCARRLERQALASPLPEAGPAEVARRLCGVHAQVMPAAELSIGLRTRGSTRQDVQDALWTERRLVKTYGPRGTLHLLPAQDLPMWVGALSALPYARVATRDGLLTEAQAEAVMEAMAVVLEQAELTADELTAALVDRLGAWAGDPVMEAFQGRWPRWRMAQATAGIRGVLCFGPNRGRQVTYTSPRRWLPGFAPADEQTAMAGVLHAYLHAYGPAAPPHFAWWLEAPRRWAVELFQAHAADLEEVDVDGEPAWVSAGDTQLPSGPPQGVRLLPYFDSYAVGCYPRELVFPGRAYERALAGGQAGNFPVLLDDGVVAGVWHQRRSGRKINITVEPLVELSGRQRRLLDDQVERIGEFFNGVPRLTFGTVTAGPHA
jgi:hypothetical protein